MQLSSGVTQSPSMHLHLPLLTRLAALALLLAPPAAAQQSQPALLEASVGAGHLSGGPPFTSRGGYAVDALLGARVRPLPAGALVLALNGAMQGPVVSNDMCTLTAGGDCVGAQPIFYTVGVLAGWANRTGSLRALAGPASVQADGGDRALGVQARLDGASPALYHVAAVLSLRGTLVPNYRGDALGLMAFGVGLRLR